MPLKSETTVDTPPRRFGIKVMPRAPRSPGASKAPRAGGPSAAKSARATPEASAVPGRRNPKWIALGIIALCLGGLLSYVIYSSVATQTAVVGIAATVNRGETIEASDLAAVTIGSVDAGVTTVPAAQMDDIVGQRAVYDLIKGSILPADAVTSQSVPESGRAVIGVKLASGRAPVGLLTPGSPIRLVAIPPAGSQAGFKDEYTGKTFLGRVVSQSNGVDGTSIVVNADVAAQQAPVVAALGAQERLTLVRDSDR